MRRELFHARYIEVCQSRCQGRRESFARLIQNVGGRNPHISFQFMITIEVITIGEVPVSLKRSPLGDATWGRFFQLAQSQGSVDTDDKKGAAQSKPHEGDFRTAQDCEVQVEQKREQGDCRTGGCVQAGPSFVVRAML